MDAGEGQRFDASPGSLVSDVQKVHIDPARKTAAVSLALTKTIPGVPAAPETEWVKRFRITSKLASTFWGHPMTLGAVVLLPKGYAENTTKRYPVVYTVGHYSERAPLGFTFEGCDKPETPEAPKPATPAKTPAAAFSPAQAQAQMGGTVSLSIVLSDVENLFSSPLSIRFDPKVLRLNDATLGDLLRNDNNPVAFTKNIQNDTGSASIQLNCAPGAPGVSGVGTVVTLNFQATGRGNTTVTISGLTVRNPQGQAIGTTGPQPLVVNVK
jgi:hypothetical protein